MEKIKIAGHRLGDEGLSKAAEDSGGGFGLIWAIPKDDGMSVRFLTEPREWYGYREWWNGRTFEVVLEDTKVPADVSPSKRTLAPAVRIDGDRDMVIVAKLPQTVIKSLDAMMTRYGTMLDRPYHLSRSGSGKDVEYSVVPDAPEAFPFEKYEAPDPEEALIDDILRQRGQEADPFEAEETESFDEPAAAPEQDAVTGSQAELFPGGEYRRNYTEAELKSMDEGDLWGIAIDLWGISLDPTAGRVDLIIEILSAQRDHEVHGEAKGTSPDRLAELPIRELRMLAKTHGVETKAVTRDDLVKALVEVVEP